jgi:hypothetical protein
MKRNYHNARSNRCSVPAPSVCSGVGEWMVIAGQLLGKGSDHGAAAEPGESIGRQPCLD